MANTVTLSFSSFDLCEIPTCVFVLVLSFLSFASPKERNKEKAIFSNGSAGKKIALLCCRGEYNLAPQQSVRLD